MYLLTDVVYIRLGGAAEWPLRVEKFSFSIKCYRIGLGDVGTWLHGVGNDIEIG